MKRKINILLGREPPVADTPGPASSTAPVGAGHRPADNRETARAEIQALVDDGLYRAAEMRCMQLAAVDEPLAIALLNELLRPD